MSTSKRRHRLFDLIAVAVAGAVAGAVVAAAVGELARSSASPPAAASQIITVRPARDAFLSARFVPPAQGPCRSADLSLRVVPTAPPSPNTVASVAVISTRACRLGGRQRVTPRRADGHAAAPPVEFGAVSGDYHAVTVSPGHAARLWIGFADPGCRLDKNPPATLIATAFSFDLDGAKGVFRLGQPVTACPMDADIESTDIFTKGDVELAGPAVVKTGGRFDAHVDLNYLDTAAAVLDPCPTAWARVTPQSALELTTYWQLACHGMRPIAFGDHLSVDLPLTIPAGLPSQSADITVGFGSPSLPGPPPSSPAALRVATQRIWVTGDHPLQPVPFVAIPAPPTPALRRTTSPPCDVTDLALGNLHLPSNGAGGQVSMWFTLVNVTTHPCTLLSDTPLRLSAPGSAELTVPLGNTITPTSVDGELAAGGTTAVQIDVGSSCNQGAPVVNYTGVNIELPHGILGAPFPIAVRCGVESPGIGVSGLTVSMDNLVDSIDVHAPTELTRGRPTTIQVTLNSYNGADLTQMGYAVTVAGIEARYGFETLRLLPDLPTVFDIQVDPPASLPPGPTSLRIEVLTGTVPAAQVPITLT